MGTPFENAEIRERVDSLIELGRSLRRHDYARMRLVANEAFEMACAEVSGVPVYPYGMAAALALMAHRNCAIGEWTAALSEAEQALALLESDEPDLVRGEIFDASGKAYLWMGNHGRALDHLMHALIIAETIGDTSLQAYVLDSIANVYSASINEVASALETQNRALELHRALGDRMGEALVLNNRAYTYMALNELDAALESATAALAYAEAEGREFLYTGVLDTLSDVHLSRGDLEEARRYTLLSVEASESADNRPNFATSKLSLARVELGLGNLSGTRTHALRALELFEALGATVEISECCYLLAEASKRVGDFEQALAYYERFHELRETHLAETSNGRLAELRVGYELENARKDAEILQLHSIALEREVEESRIAHARLAARASLDALTGLYNRGHLPSLETELSAAAAAKEPVSLIVLDIDHFKDINDAHGHLAGDLMLTSISSTIKKNARTTDTPVRYGGDEFLVLLIGLDSEDAAALAERLRIAVSEARIRHGAATLQATVSIGVATEVGDSSGLAALIARADAGLYAAKKAGRDRVVVNDRRQQL